MAKHEAGAKCADLCRKHGKSAGTFCNRKARFGGMTVPEAKRLKALKDENAKLKKLLAEQVPKLANERVAIAAWAAGQNAERPHSALEYRTPADQARTFPTAIALPVVRDASLACQPIAQPAPIGANTDRAPFMAG